SAVGSVIGLTGPMLIQQAMDIAIPDKNVQLLLRLSGLLTVTILVNIGFNALRTVIVAKVGQNIVYDLRKDLFDHLQDLPFSCYYIRPHAKILARVVHDGNAVSHALSNGILGFIIEIINIVCIIVFLVQVGVPRAGITVAGLPVVAFFICL